MKTIISDNFMRSAAMLRRHNAAYFLSHPAETERTVRLLSSDTLHSAVLTLKNPYRK